MCPPEGSVLIYLYYLFILCIVLLLFIFKYIFIYVNYHYYGLFIPLLFVDLSHPHLVCDDLSESLLSKSPKVFGGHNQHAPRQSTTVIKAGQKAHQPSTRGRLLATAQD